MLSIWIVANPLKIEHTWLHGSFDVSDIFSRHTQPICTATTPGCCRVQSRNSSLIDKPFSEITCNDQSGTVNSQVLRCPITKLSQESCNSSPICRSFSGLACKRGSTESKCPQAHQVCLLCAVQPLCVQKLDPHVSSRPKNPCPIGALYNVLGNIVPR